MKPTSFQVQFMFQHHEQCSFIFREQCTPLIRSPVLSNRITEITSRVSIYDVAFFAPPCSNLLYSLSANFVFLTPPSVRTSYMEAHYILIRGRTVLQYKHPSCLALCPPTSATRSPSSSALPSVVPTCSSVLAPPSSSGSSSSVDPSVNSSDWLSHVLSSTFVFSSSVLDEAVKKVSQFCF